MKNPSRTGHVVSQMLRPIRTRATGSDLQEWQIRCIIQGETVTFTIKVPTSNDIGALKLLVHASAVHDILRDTDSKDIVLCKVSNVFGCNSTSTNFLCFIDLDHQSLAALGATLDDQSAEELKEWTKVNAVWSSPPPDGRIHIFVKHQPTGEQKLFL